MSSLREYQENALQAVAAAKDRGVSRQIIALATGLGKTHIAAHLIKRQSGRALFLAPFEEIVHQSARRIQEIVPERSTGVVKARLNQIYSDVVVGSVPTLTRENRLKQLASDFSTVMVDECHLNLDGYRKIADRLAGQGALIVGLSATPYRLDGRGLDEVFEEIVFEMGIPEGISQGHLCDIEGYRFKLAGADFTKVHTRKGDLEAKELEAVMKASNFDEHITRKWLELASDRHTVVFLPKVAMAYQLAEYMKSQGIRAAALDGAVDQRERGLILRQYNEGEIQVLINVLCLSTGWDSPRTDCLVMARPTKSKSLYIQTLGRGLRPNPPSKRNCLVLDIAGVTERHDLQSLASLAGVRKMKEGESFAAAIERAAVEARDAEHARQREEEKTRLAAELAAHRVDLLGHSYPLEDRKSKSRHASFHWQVNEANNQRSLQLDDRSILVRPMTDGSWLARDGKGWQHIGDTAEACQQAAEEHARSLQKKAREKWRTDPATDAQLYRLRQWRIRHDPFNITKGEAKDLMDQFIERKKGAVV